MNGRPARVSTLSRPRIVRVSPPEPRSPEACHWNADPVFAQPVYGVRWRASHPERQQPGFERWLPTGPVVSFLRDESSAEY